MYTFFLMYVSIYVCICYILYIHTYFRQHIDNLVHLWEKLTILTQLSAAPKICTTNCPISEVPRSQFGGIEQGIRQGSRNANPKSKPEMHRDASHELGDFFVMFFVHTATKAPRTLKSKPVVYMDGNGDFQPFFM